MQEDLLLGCQMNSKRMMTMDERLLKGQKKVATQILKEHEALFGRLDQGRRLMIIADFLTVLAGSGSERNYTESQLKEFFELAKGGTDEKT